MKIKRIGLDLAKNVFQVYGVDGRELGVVSRKLRRGQVIKFFTQLDREPKCVVGMEACGGAHHWARELAKLGYQTMMLNPRYVKAFAVGNKNDANDAKAICEAAGRPEARTVAVKTLAQQDMLSLHKVRAQLIKRRTGLANQTRGLLLEYGIAVEKKLGQLRAALPRLLEEAENALTPVAREVMARQYEELCHLDERLKKLDRELEALARQDEQSRALMALPGYGPVSATAVVAMVGDGRQYRCGRDCAAGAGIVPGQASSGGKERLLGISKRGNRYLRTVLIHGARSAVKAAVGKDKNDPLSQWIKGLRSRKHGNVVAVALANKMLRVAWALLRHGGAYAPAA